MLKVIYDNAIKESYFISNIITFLLTSIQYNNQFHVE